MLAILRTYLACGRHTGVARCAQLLPESFIFSAIMSALNKQSRRSNDFNLYCVWIRMLGCNLLVNFGIDAPHLSRPRDLHFNCCFRHLTDLYRCFDFLHSKEKGVSYLSIWVGSNLGDIFWYTFVLLWFPIIK